MLQKRRWQKLAPEMSVKRREKGRQIWTWPGGQGGMEEFSNLRVVRRKSTGGEVTGYAENGGAGRNTSTQRGSLEEMRYRTTDEGWLREHWPWAAPQDC